MELINEGIDAHFWFGERIAKYQGIDWATLDDAKKKWFRQYAKVGNFGFPGGLGPKTLQKSARGYGLDLTLEQCKLLRELWLEAFPEMALHLKPQEDQDNPGMYVGSTVTGRTRRNATFCASANYACRYTEAHIKPGELRESLDKSANNIILSCSPMVILSQAA